MNGIDKIIARMEADTQAECADIAAQAAAEARLAKEALAPFGKRAAWFLTLAEQTLTRTF